MLSISIGALIPATKPRGGLNISDSCLTELDNKVVPSCRLFS